MGAPASLTQLWRWVTGRRTELAADPAAGSPVLPREQWPDGGERWFDVVRTIIDDPNNHWWDNLATPTTVERRDDILRDALIRARDEPTGSPKYGSRSAPLPPSANSLTHAR